MICNKCGNQVGDGQRYCQACGNDMMQVNNQPTYQQPAYNQYQQPQGYYQQPYPYQNVQPKKKGHGCIIAICIVLGLLLLTIGGCTYVVYKIAGGWDNLIENSDKIVCCSDAGGTWEDNACTLDDKEAEEKYNQCVAEFDELDDDSNSNEESNDNSNTYSNDNSNVYSNDNSNSNQPTPQVGTYKIGKFTFNTPVGYKVTEKTDSALLTSGYKNISMKISTGSYDNLKANKALLSSYFSKAGYTVTNIKTVTYNNVEFLSGETTSQGYKLLIAYAKLDASNVVIVSTTNAGNTVTPDYSLLSDISVSIRSARTN